MNASPMRRLLAGATAACALLVALPGAALAANATWSSTGFVNMSSLGSFTVQDTTMTYTCPATGPTTTWGYESTVNNAGDVGSGGFSNWTGLGYRSFNCVDSNGGGGYMIQFLSQPSQMQAIKTGSTFSLTSTMAMRVLGSLPSTPYPTPAANYTATWYNGNANGPSVARFVDAPVSRNVYGGIVKLTGWFVFRTSSGAPLYLT